MSRRLTTLLLFAILLPASMFPQQTGQQEENEPSNIQQMRAEYFARLRGVKPGQVKAERRLKALQQLKLMRNAEKQKLTSLTSPTSFSSAPNFSGSAGSASTQTFSSLAISSTQWTSIGPSPVHYSYLTAGDQNYSGRVTALAVDPTDSNVVYSGAADGGVWKTTDGGQTWTPLTDAQDSLSIGSIAIDPNNPSTIYVGTGEGNSTLDNYPGVGVLKSTDGGQSWTLYQGPFLSWHIGAMAVDPANSQIVLAASYDLGLYRSTDAGVNWTPALPNFQATAVLFDPSNPGSAYAAGWDSNGYAVLHSSDEGATWIAIERQQGYGRVALTLSQTTVYALFSNSTLFKSTDLGNTWTQLTNQYSQFCSGQCSYNLVIAASPTNPNNVFLGAINLMHTNDGGSSGSWAVESVHDDQHALAFSPDGSTLYLGNDGGVWSTNNPTQPIGTAISFSDLNASLATLQFYRGISIAAGNPGIGMGGTQDNDSELYTGSTSWQGVCTGDGFSTAINPLNPSIMYCTTQDGFVGESTNAGQGFNAIFPQNTSRFDTLLTLDQTNPQYVYTERGDNIVHQSADGGSTWQSISPAFPYIYSITVAPSDSGTVWVATGNGAAVTHDAGDGAGAIWSTSSAPNGGIVQVVADPGDPTTAYAVGGQTGGSGGRVFKLTGSGATWTDITGNLPDVPATDIVADPDQANTLYVATDIGVFSTTDGGNTWSTLVQGLPRSVVTGLALDRASRVLRAATHGRSMWDLQLPPAPGTGTGIVSGVVVDISTNQPIAGASVSFSGGSTTTDANGNYQFSGVASGSYSVTAQANGYFAEPRSLTVSPGVTTTLNFQLPTGGILAGTVSSNQGGPIAGATVALDGGKVPTNLTLTTDSSGNYNSDYIPIGRYTVVVSAPGFNSNNYFLEVATGVTTVQNVTLNAIPQKGNFSGKVVDNADNPIAGAKVSFAAGGATTASDGTYSFTNVVVGTYNVTATAMGYNSVTQPVTVTQGTTATLNFNLTSSSGGGGCTVPSFTAPGDFNGDCKSDILWRNSSSGEVYLWLMKGTTITSGAAVGTVTTDWSIQGVGDFNGDGKADILWRNSTSGQVYPWLMNGTTITSGAAVGTVTTDWSIQGVGDFNGDGKADILWRNNTTGQVYLWLMNGTTITSGVAVGTVTTDWSIQGVGDFNGDGKADILWRNSSSGEVYLWLMNGTTITSGAAVSTTVTTDWSIQGLGDFNRDGEADILWRNNTSGQVYLWLMNGTTITSGAAVGTVTTDWSIQGVGYFNGDGKADILWRNSTSGEVYLWLMNGTTTTSGAAVGTVTTDWSIHRVGT